MSKPSRCKKCLHRPGVRRVTSTRKTAGNPTVAARVHKKPCLCACHPVADAAERGA